MGADNTKLLVQQNQPKKSLIKYLTETNFLLCLLTLTKLPRPPREDSNMLSITGLIGKQRTPELFQIYQIHNDFSIKPTYHFRHYEVDTHNILTNINNIDPVTFEFPYSYENKTISLIYGEDFIFW